MQCDRTPMPKASAFRCAAALGGQRDSYCVLKGADEQPKARLGGRLEVTAGAVGYSMFIGCALSLD